MFHGQRTIRSYFTLTRESRRLWGRHLRPKTEFGDSVVIFLQSQFYLVPRIGPNELCCCAKHDWEHPPEIARASRTKNSRLPHLAGRL